jgi:urease accessory protein UreE
MCERIWEKKNITMELKINPVKLDERASRKTGCKITTTSSRDLVIPLPKADRPVIR